MDLQSVVQQKFNLSAENAAYLIKYSNPDELSWYWLAKGKYDLYITEKGLISYWRRPDYHSDYHLSVSYEDWLSNGNRFNAEQDAKRKEAIANEASIFAAIAPWNENKDDGFRTSDYYAESMANVAESKSDDRDFVTKITDTLKEVFTYRK